MSDQADILIIGGGIAGAALAYFLAGRQQVVILERESQVGYHATGRSAAVFTPDFGTTLVRQLSRASAGFLQLPPSGFAAGPLLTPRGQLLLAGPAHAEHLIAQAGAKPHWRCLTPMMAAEMVPLLRQNTIAVAYHDAEVYDIDVDLLHQSYLRHARARGCRLITNAELRGVSRQAGQWCAETTQGSFTAPLLVNAAGAWADAVAAMTAARPLGLIPKRRTAMLIDPPAGSRPEHWPLTADTGIGFYIKPDAGRLLASPMDATPSPACDAQPEELDIALCIDHVQQRLDLPVRRVFRAWAGLRSFLSDESPVAGYDRQVEGFFWLAGQGGFGIQTSPALGQAAAAILQHHPLPAALQQQGITIPALAPDRVSLAYPQDSTE